LTSLLLQIRDYTNSTANSTAATDMPSHEKYKSKQREVNSNNEDENDDDDDEDHENDDTTEGLDDENEKKNAKMTAFLPFCSQTLNESIEDIKKNLLNKNNVKLFEDKIQIHLSHIQSLYHFNKLHAFKYSWPIENDLKAKSLRTNEAPLNEEKDMTREDGTNNVENNIEIETSNASDFNHYNINIIKPQVI
jgi:hypothetical protein